MAKTKKELAEQYIALRNKFEGDNIKPGVKVWWRDSDHLCKIWKVQDFLDAMERLKNTYHEKLTPAPLDEKNVTTDWIDDIFDDSSCTCNGSTYTGFVKDSVCSCLVGSNTIIWKIDKDYAKDAMQSYKELQEAREGARRGEPRTGGEVRHLHAGAAATRAAVLLGRRGIENFCRNHKKEV